ncbi:MAG: hypothetical protein LC685_05480 [Actinobacteria bacterium]|nr:hypothetical protein [Actinomycetota bacterium]
MQTIRDGIYVVSYLSPSGHALTTVVDEKTGKVVSVASNEKERSTHRGRLAA